MGNAPSDESAPAVSSGGDVDPDASGRDELLLEFYGLLRGAAESNIDQAQRRLTGGIGSIAAIFGYAVLGNDPRIYAGLPFVIGVLIVVDLEATATLSYLNYRMALIEQALSADDGLIVWEREYGMFGEGRRLTALGVDLNLTYFGFVVAAVAAGYLASIGIAIEAWRGVAPASKTVVGVPIPWVVLAVGYGLLSVAVLVAGAVTVGHYRRTRRNIRG